MWCTIRLEMSPAPYADARPPVTEWRLGLSCLMHPWSLIALALLGFNDHWWKGVGPDWITGKLSDVAGLFFFPFLVTIAIGALRSRPSRDLGLGRAVFVGIGIWFAAVKTIPTVHEATHACAALLVGPVQIVCDPTDVVAVLALFPAWWLYRRMAAAPRRPFMRMLQPPVVSLAVLLTAATSKAREPMVLELVSLEGELYAVVGDANRRDGSRTVFTTTDGMEWTLAKSPPWKAGNTHQVRTELQHRGRTLQLEGRHVRALRGNEVQEEWSYPDIPMRLGQHRLAQDIASLPGKPDIVIVAFGTEGVAVRQADGMWTRHAVGGATPTPKPTPRIEAARLPLATEVFFSLSTAMLAWVFLSLLAWLTKPTASLPTATIPGQSRLRRFLSGPGGALRPFQWNGAYLLLGLLGLVLPLATFAAYLRPLPNAPGEAFYLTRLEPAASTLFLVLSVIPIALGWRRYLCEVGRTGCLLRVPEAIAAGVLGFGAMRMWDQGQLESLSTTGALAAAGIALVVLLRAALSR